MGSEWPQGLLGGECTGWHLRGYGGPQVGATAARGDRLASCLPTCLPRNLVRDRQARATADLQGKRGTRQKVRSQSWDPALQLPSDCLDRTRDWKRFAGQKRDQLRHLSHFFISWNIKNTHFKWKIEQWL